MAAMRAFLLRFAVLAGGLFAVAAASAADPPAPPIQIKLVSPPDHPPPQGPHNQIDPTTDLRATFPRASQISVGVAVVPDPTVPRYRRLYDLSVEAIELGMLEGGYVLDRYSLPWEKKLKMGSSTEPEAGGTATPPMPAPDETTADEPYGLLVFRCDAWRKGICRGSRETEARTQVRALYVVTDTATYGLSDASLRKAVRRIRDQLSMRDPVSADQPGTQPTKPQVARNLDASDPSSEIPGFWHPGCLTPRTLPTTPVTAQVFHVTPATACLLKRNQTLNWQRLLAAWMYKGTDDSEHRAAVFLLFATEIGVLRWLVAGAVVCALGSVGIVYLFPIESDMLLLLNLGLMIGAGAIAGYMATTFEGDALLSNVLCNRPRKGKLSITLFIFIAMPFLALAGAIAITKVPGVVDWSGGVIGLLLGLGLHP